MPKMIFRSPRVNDLDQNHHGWLFKYFQTSKPKPTYPVSGSNKQFVIAMRLSLTWHFSDTQLVLISEVRQSAIALWIPNEILPSGGGARHPGSGPG